MLLLLYDYRAGSKKVREVGKIIGNFTFYCRCFVVPDQKGREKAYSHPRELHIYPS